MADPRTRHGSSETVELILDGGRLRYLAGYLPRDAADRLMAACQRQINWQQRFIRMHGREIPMPRLTAWIGDPEARYRYSGQTFEPDPWPPALAALRAQLQADTGLVFNAVLANLYRDGNDSVSWHADNEAELQPAPQIASISLGATRRFQLQHRRPGQKRKELLLEHGSLLLMLDDTQANWRHQLPKTREPVGPRINLTFRLVRHPATQGSEQRLPVAD